MLSEAVKSGAFIFPLLLAVLAVIAMFATAAHQPRSDRKIYGGSWRPLLTTAVTLPGVLLTLSAGALAFLAQRGLIADAGLLLAGMSLYPVIQIMAVWILAGTVRYTDSDADTITFQQGKGWAYIGAFGSVYILLVLAIGFTSGFFVFKSSLLAPIAPRTVAENRSMVQLLRSPVRVGDARSMVIALWGRPDSVRSRPRALFYSGPATIVTVSLDSKRLVQTVTSEAPNGP